MQYSLFIFRKWITKNKRNHSWNGDNTEKQVIFEYVGYVKWTPTMRVANCGLVCFGHNIELVIVFPFKRNLTSSANNDTCWECESFLRKYFVAFNSQGGVFWKLNHIVHRCWHWGISFFGHCNNNYINNNNNRKDGILSGLREVDFAKPDSYLFIRGQPASASAFTLSNCKCNLRFFNR